MNYNYLDDSGYPTEECLDKIKNWKIDNNNLRDIMEFIKPVWKYADCGYWMEENGKYLISTGGWSGNEEIIDYMHQNFLLWMLYWEQSRRGGHYIFSKRSIE